MYPLHKEKYYLTGDTYYEFMRDRTEEQLKKEQRGCKVMIAAMLVAAAATGALQFVGGESVKGDLVYILMPFVFIALAAAQFLKIGKIERDLNDKIIKQYISEKFEKDMITLEFYEDKLTYKKGDVKDEYDYNTFLKYYESDKFFCIYFNTGDIVMLNPNCKKDKIKDIIGGYVKGVKEN